MSTEQDRFELVRAARENAHRVAERLRHYRDDLARVMPGDVQGGEALRDAVATAERLEQVLQNSAGGPPPAADPSAS